MAAGAGREGYPRSAAGPSPRWAPLRDGASEPILRPARAPAGRGDCDPAAGLRADTGNGMTTSSFKHGHAATRKRGQSRTYQSWMSMKERCDSPKHKSYADYGGRGIGYCARWIEFVNFLVDMGVRPEGKTLGRKDNSGGYSLENCEWQTYKEQARNRDNNTFLEYQGLRLTIAEWSDRLGLTQDTISKRLSFGWPTIRVLGQAPRKQKNSKCNFVGTCQYDLFV